MLRVSYIKHYLIVQLTADGSINDRWLNLQHCKKINLQKILKEKKIENIIENFSKKILLIFFF